jgi:alanine racemase
VTAVPWAPGGGPPRAEAVVDLEAISVNVSALSNHVGGRDVMAVVKADGYGHGILQSAAAARSGGATWLGVALLDEALQLRAAGDTGPILSWLAVPGERYGDGVAAGVELGVYTTAQLNEVAEAARGVGRRAAVQLKLDTGLGRGGARPADWGALVDEAAKRQADGQIEVTGIWSHLARSDEVGHPSIALQTGVFESGVSAARDAGLDPRHLHLANSGAALAAPETWFTMVRPGIAVYGVTPLIDGSSPLPLRPAMTLRAAVALVKRVDAGHGVSYGHTFVTERATTLALIPLGYGDGIPRHASNRGEVAINARRYRMAGRVCMDQFVIDVGDDAVQAGDPAVIFGDPDLGYPSALDWAAAADTIGYEIVTRIASRVPRRYVGGAVGVTEATP